MPRFTFENDSDNTAPASYTTLQAGTVLLTIPGDDEIILKKNAAARVTASVVYGRVYDFNHNGRWIFARMVNPT